MQPAGWCPYAQNIHLSVPPQTFFTLQVVHDDTKTTPWQHSVCTVTFQQQSVWQSPNDDTYDAPVSQPAGNGTYDAFVSLVVRSTSLNDTKVPWRLSFASAGGYTDGSSTSDLVNTTVADGAVSGLVAEADQTLLAQAGNAPSFDFLIASNFVNFDPVNATINGEPCAIIISSNATLQPLLVVNASANATGGAQTESAGGLTTANGQVTDYDGNVLQFKGLNWFGFDDGNTGPDGLWAGSSALTLDFGNIMLRIKALGFNAIRLPFSFKVCAYLCHHPVMQHCCQLTRSLLCHPSRDTGFSFTMRM